MLKKLIFSLFSVLIFFDLFPAEVRELTASEKFVKELSQEFPQTMTYIKMHEVPSNLANKLNKLFTPVVQKAFLTENFSFLEHAGFKFLQIPTIFTHKDFPEYVFKIPYGEDLIFILTNLTRIWYANWIRMIQNEFKVPKKQVFFMKSQYPRLAMIVVADKKDFIVDQILNAQKKVKLKEIGKITGFHDTHSGNVSQEYIIDTEGSITKFLEDPFQIHEDPKGIRAKL